MILPPSPPVHTERFYPFNNHSCSGHTHHRSCTLHLGIGGLGGGLNACPDCLGRLFREELSKFKWLFSCFWGGLNNCPDGLWHIFIATMVIFSNWSQNAQPGPAPECPVECGGGGVIAIWAVPKCRVHERLWDFGYSLTRQIV